ncbi:MAG: hypothetical protein JST84_04275 [Acidobacteria bacterium]|nr:hypothetical protein [Acidobacteriota bacterium]
MQYPAYYDFTLVKDIKSYQDATSLTREGTIPLIIPFEDKRLAKWKEVLAWYGLSTVEYREVMEQDLSDQRNIVISIGEAFSVPARFYADANNRAFLHIQDGEIDDVVNNQAYESLLFIAPSEYFTISRIRELARGIDIPWGFITAQDLPGITFVIAKLLAGRSSPHRNCGIIDLISNTEQQANINGRLNVPTIIDCNRIQSLVIERNWHTIILRAHGEAAHVNLNSVVLCGLVNEVERVITGEPIDGCRINSGIRQCKRVHSKDTHIISFGDIKALHLFVYSCLSLAVNNGLYPSNLSTIHSIGEGYPRMAVITDRVLHIHPLDPIIVLDLCRQEIGFGEVVQFENDLALRRINCRPYVLFGDPLGSTPRWATIDYASKKRPGSVNTVIPLHLKEWSDVEIIGLDNSDSEIYLMRGRDKAAIIRPVARGKTSTGIIDKTDMWHMYTEWFKKIGKRLQRAASIERAISILYKLQEHSIPGFQDMLRNISKVRVMLEEGVQESLQICEFVRREGVWNNSLDLWVNLCTLKVSLWDHQLASLILNHLFAGDLQDTLTHSFIFTARSESLDCHYCRSPLTTLRLVDPLECQPDQYVVKCPSCGVQEVWEYGGERILVDLPPSLCPTYTSKINLCFSTSQTQPLQYIRDGVLIVELVDKGNNNVLFRLQERVNSNPYTLVIDVPAEITSELHTIKLAWIHGLFVTYLRRRWPSYGPLTQSENSY